MLHKHKFNLLIGTLAFLLTVVGQYLYHLQAPQLAPEIGASKYITLWVILFVFSYISNSFMRFLALSFIPLLAFFQWVKLSYFGTRVFPHEIWLLFTEAGEVFGTLKEELHHFIFPVLLAVVPCGILFFINRKLAPKLAGWRFMWTIFVFYLVFNPIRTYFTGNTWGRQPSIEEFDGVNVYLSMSYFFGRILPSKLSNERKISEQISMVDAGPGKEINLIFVLGESLAPGHMSLFGYSKQTTPYLESLKADPNFYYAQGVSSGVSTDVAIAFLFNNTHFLLGTQYVSSGSMCLFNLARKKDYKTTFYSAQSEQQLRYISPAICPRSIQDLKSLDKIDPTLADPNAADDLILISQLKNLNLKNSTKNFVVLHMRGTHAPYNLRYPEAFAKFAEWGSSSKDRPGHYDNGVAYFDHFMQKLIEEVKTYNKPTLVLYVSDHGEGLGEEGVWGHGRLHQISATIPILMYKHKLDGLSLQLPPLPTHFNVSLLMSELMGFKLNFDSRQQVENYEVLGNDIDGFAGRLQLRMDKSGTIIQGRTIQ